MRKFSVLVIILAISLTTQAQPWMKNIDPALQKSGNYTFYDVQKAFEKYWDGRVIPKGKGWKQFKRWENYMEPRVYPSGRLPKANLWNEYQTLKNAKGKGIKASWTHMGPVGVPTDINTNEPMGVGRINFVAFHPTDPQTLFIGAPAGGFWKSHDGGNTWATSTDELASIGVSAIAVHPVHPDTIYIATGDRDAGDTYSIGILKSADGGDSWQATGMTFGIEENRIIERILIHPDNPEILIVATNHGIFRSVDNGDNFTLIMTGNFNELKFKPGDPSVLYAALVDNSSGASIFKSTDTGVNFTKITSIPSLSSVGRVEFAFTQANTDVVYALASGSDDGFHALYKSINNGSNWTTQSDYNDINLLGWDTNGGDSGGQGWYDLSIAVSPTNENEVYVGGVNIWRSINGGQNWTLNAHWYGGGGAEYVHADQHFLGYNPLNGDLFSGCDGGVYRKPAGKTSWIDVSAGIEILQIYRIGNSYTDSTEVIGGNQDNGTYLRKNENWNAVIGGDGMDCMIDYTRANIMYGEYYYGSMFRSDDGGYNFSEITPGSAGSGAWITPMIMHPTLPNIIYSGFRKVWKSTNKGGTWTAVSGDMGSTIRAMVISPSDTRFMYATTSTKIYRNSSGGTSASSWVNVSSGLPNHSITGVTISNENPEHVWVSLSGYTAGEKIFYSETGGNTWVNYSDGLPNVPANCIMFQKSSNGLVYAGTDIGVYIRDTTMDMWEQYSDGLPNVVVNELEIHYPSQKIRAATYGRGLWQSGLYGFSPAYAVAGFTYNADHLTVTFNDTSEFADSHLWNFGDGQTSTLVSPVHTYSQTGTYEVSLIVKNDYNSDTAWTTLTYPIAGFNYSDDHLAVTFTSVSQNSSSVKWEFGDGETSVLNEVIHTYAQGGDYNVNLIAINDLSSDTANAVLHVSPIGISELERNSAVQISPNPGKNHFELTFNLNFTGKISISVTDAKGQEVYTTETTITSKESNTILDLTGKPEGIYHVTVTAGKEIFTSKLVIQK